MDELFALAILIAIAIPVLSIVAIVMASGASGRARRLEERVRVAEARIAMLEARPVGAAPAAEAPPVAEEQAVAQPAEAAEEQAIDAARGEVAPQPEEIALPEEPIVAPARKGRGFDERAGARWAVWVGGLALAFGAVFLVKYSIEQGYFGPGMRIAMGLALSLVLLGLGERFRRSGLSEAVAGLPGEHIPSVLTGAGTVAAFATIYAAHALYGMIGPGLAFTLLGLVGVATLVASALHKQWLAALGLVGAYVTPLLIDSPAANYWALTGYLAVVTAAALKLADWRNMLWLAGASVVAAVGWGVVLAVDVLPIFEEPAIPLYALALGAIFAHVFAMRPTFRVAWSGIVPAAAAAALGVLAMSVWLNSAFMGLSFYVLLALVAGMLVLALKESANALLPAVAALTAVAGYALWATADLYYIEPQQWAINAAAPEGYAIAGLILAALLGAGGLVLAVLTPARAISAAVGVASPLLFFLLAYRGATYTPPAPSIPADVFGIVALALAAGFASLASMLARLEDKHPQDQGYPQALGIYAAGSVAALALGLAMLLEKGWLVVGLALASFAVSWISTQRPVPYLRGVAAATGIVVAIQLLRDPVVAPEVVGTTPFFNWLIWAYGVPAAAFAAAAFVLRRKADDSPVRIFEALSILFAAAFAFLEMRHFIHGGDLLVADFTLAEQGLTTMLALAFSIGLQRINRRAGSPVLRIASLAAGAFSFAAIAAMHFVLLNPFFTGRSIGTGLIFNDLLLGYTLPALMAGLVYLFSAGRPQWFLRSAGGLALALAFAWISLEVRAYYHGEYLDRGYTSAAEWYTYSAVWLGFGVALLAGGLLLNVKALRYASAAVILFTVCKVFLFDMSALEGILRALSFLGLGAVLIAIGYAYQKLLFAPASEEAQPGS